MARALINVPATAKKGEVIEIKALISHPMETGFRTLFDGTRPPRDIIRTFTCRYNGQEIFRAELCPAVAANPFFAFSTRATASGVLEFRWVDEHGKGQVETAKITVA